MAVKLDLLTKEEISERFLVDVRTISDWVSKGLPQRMRSGRPVYDWGEGLVWYTQHIRDDERAKRHAGGDEEKKATLADAKVRTALAEAEQAEIALAKARGESVPRAFMREEFQRIGGRIRTKLVQTPNRWTSRLLAAATGFTELRLALVDVINELMPELRELAGEDVPAIVEAELPPAEQAS
jgi:phage terminase Nu1 subunit (DNA packaging protein)